jgi:hypothetical protein
MKCFALIYALGVGVCWACFFVLSVFWEKERRKTGEDYNLVPFLILCLLWPFFLIVAVPGLVFIFIANAFRWVSNKIVDRIELAGHTEVTK